MGELLVGASQSSLLLGSDLGFHNPTSSSRLHFCNRSSFRLQLRSNHQPQLHQHRLFSGIVARVVSFDSKAPAAESVYKASEDVNVQLDTSGGDGEDGFGGKGGNGGGGGDNNSGGGNKNEDEGGSEQNGKKMAMSMSQKLTLGYAALVGVGGIMGYIKSGSQKSLLAGGLSASLLYYVYTVLPSKPVFASSLGLGLSAALLGVMGSRFKRSGKVLPAGVVSLVSLVMTGGYLHGIMRSMH